MRRCGPVFVVALVLSAVTSGRITTGATPGAVYLADAEAYPQPRATTTGAGTWMSA